MESLVVHSLPHDFLRVRRSAIRPIKIGAKFLPFYRRMHAERRKWDFHGDVPLVTGFIDAGGMLEPGIPLPAIFVMFAVQIDVEINPLVLRRNFELFVSLD